MREPGTVPQSTRVALVSWTKPPYPALGPLCPFFDTQCDNVAIQMVLALVKSGHHPDYLQFDTLQQFRTVLFANVHHVSATGSRRATGWIDDKGFTKRSTMVASYSL